MLKDKKTGKDTREFLKNKIDSAKWFLNAILSRRDTMLKVMNAILNRQKEFFTSHGEDLKPMFEKDIAEDISMDISTVSRVVRGKYVQTDFGIFELKYFFSGGMKTDSGEDISNKMLKSKIRELIEGELKSKPLSDDKLMEMLNAGGFNIARRTVAKYRESMRIPKATLRRKIVA
jgi:RNA polymerase sigma-54 factor